MDHAYVNELLGYVPSNSGHCNHVPAKKAKQAEQAKRAVAAKKFDELIKRIRALKVGGRYSPKKPLFNTQMGATVELVTSYRGNDGVWAKITTKTGGVIHRSMLPGQQYLSKNDPERDWYISTEKTYRDQIAGMVRKHELVEQGFTHDLRTKILDYGKCNHHNHEISHNCCIEVVTIRKRK